MSYAEELAGLREALELPTVGRPDRQQDLAELRRLIARHTDEARRILDRLGQ